MPPPKAPSPQRRLSPPPTHRSPEMRKSISGSATSSSGKKGFKPVGLASNSLKRFFPGDDDDESPPHTARDTAPSSSRPDSPELRISRVNGDTPDSQGRCSRRSSIDMEESPRRSPPSREFRGARSQHRGHARHHELEPQPHPPEEPKEKLYVVLGHVGTGTFGKVYKASHTATGRMVALKQIKMEGEKEGFPVTAMREVKLLQSLRHENVVRLHEMMVSHGELLLDARICAAHSSSSRHGLHGHRVHGP